jgi:hypothetical protein
MLINKLRARVSEWWNGKLVENHLDSDIYIVGPVRSSSSRFIHRALDYILKEYKFIIATFLTLVSLILSYLAIKIQ